ncbi:hypothetical protein [Acinetobacter rathckeae]|uniref:hypothetical protein n=1 Tax=Acinetobacter rathckeae TaxID=2605272 RepID=UPI0018A3155B|nr:hypothetical protein [Acinetobacter rathckeae]MBF7686685.1 hypothetical protein [Acinetobacter rathckeae]MBF7696502.1 hypothetical protein [Acinetobacter rathckeae]
MFGRNKKPGYLAPLVITGITAGVLYKAYKAIFVEGASADPVEETPKPLPRTVSNAPKDVDDLANDTETDEPLTSK